MKIGGVLTVLIIIILSISCNRKHDGIDIIRPGEGVTDIDDNYYNTAVIGSQEWMTENLKTTRFCNGDTIPVIDNDTAFALLDSGEIFWLHYGFDPFYNEPFGKLYNWNVVNDERNVCPCGWRVPTEDDLKSLESNLYLQFPNKDFGTVANKPGNIQDGSGFWLESNYFTNESMLSFLPGGQFQNGLSFNINRTGGYWLSEPNASTQEGFRLFQVNTFGYNFQTTFSSENAYSIRCIRDF